MKTYAPSDTNRLAVASPMPLLPPVTRAIFPASLLVLITLVLSMFLLVGFILCIVRYKNKQNGQKPVNNLFSYWMKRKKIKLARGRPRAFDAEKALDSAMQ